jgi:bla regulator protein blaR1
MEYLLKSSLVLAILIISYYLFLQNETFFKSIRIYFLVGYALIITIPFVKIPIYVEHATGQLGNSTINSFIATHVGDFSLSHFTSIIPYLYLFGVAIFSSLFIFKLISLIRFLVNHSARKENGIYFIETEKDISPFSFFNIVVYNPSLFSVNELNHILAHEKTHIKQLHSFDIIITNLLSIVLWFNPFVWLLKKAVDQNLEFLADATTFQEINDHESYQFTLLKTNNTNFFPELTSSFFNGLTKKRILFLNKCKSSSIKQLKFLIVLPLLGILVYNLNTNIIAKDNENGVKEIYSSEEGKEQTQGNDNLIENISNEHSKEKAQTVENENNEHANTREHSRENSEKSSEHNNSDSEHK